jgi:hypothetical protein
MSKREFIERIYRVRREGHPQISPLRFKATLFVDEQSFSNGKMFATGEVSLPNEEDAKSEFHPNNANDLRNFPPTGGIIKLADRQESLKLIDFGNWDNTPELHYYFDYEPCFLQHQKPRCFA